MMKSALRALSLSCALLAFGCATQRPEKSTSIEKPIAHKLPLDSSLIQLYERAARLAQSVQTLEGYGSLEIDAPELRQSLGCVVKAKRGESIQIVATAFLGIVAAETLLRADSVFVHIPLQNTMLIGQNNPENLRRATGISANFKDATSVFLGAPELAAPIDSLDSVAREGNAVVYAFRAAEGWQVVEIDSATAHVRAIAQLDAAKRLQFQAIFEEPELLQNGKMSFMLPKQTVVTILEYPQEQSATQTPIARRVKIAYSSRSVNDERFMIAFTMPRYAVVRRIEEFLFFAR